MTACWSLPRDLGADADRGDAFSLLTQPSMRHQCRVPLLRSSRNSQPQSPQPGHCLTRWAPGEVSSRTAAWGKTRFESLQAGAQFANKRHVRCLGVNTCLNLLDLFRREIPLPDGINAYAEVIRQGWLAAAGTLRWRFRHPRLALPAPLWRTRLHGHPVRMTRKRVSMRKIREVLRLKFEQQLSDRLVGRSAHLARSTVQEYVLRAQRAGLTWPLPATLDDVQLEALLFPSRIPAGEVALPLPDWAQVDQELRRKGVTRRLLWEEYRQQHAGGVQYATFNEHYRAWKSARGLSMRQHHRAGEKLFVDYAGLTVPITEARTGTVQAGQVFVATLGASDYTYAEVTRTQNSDDWLSSHVRGAGLLWRCPGDHRARQSEGWRHPRQSL